MLAGRLLRAPPRFREPLESTQPTYYRRLTRSLEQGFAQPTDRAPSRAAARLRAEPRLA